MTKKILCVGEALIDMICTDTGKSLLEGQHFLKKPGGAPTNVAAAIAALGGHVELAAKIGNDPFGKQLIAVMKDFGVSVRWMFQDDHFFTTFAFVSLMNDGERDFVFNRGADGQLTVQDVEALDLEDFSIVHFGSATAFLEGPLQETYTALLQRAKEKNRFISFDPNYRHLLFKDHTDTFIKQSWNFIHQCHFFKVSDEEALLLTGCANIADAADVFLEKTKAVFAITLGKDGTLLGIDHHTTTIASIPVKPVDTTGAGDAFVGAVLFQLSELPGESTPPLNAETWHRIIINANKAGARTCEFLGAMEAFKHLSNTIFQ